MPNSIVFTPKHEKQHKKNLIDFVAFAKQLPPLNDKCDYESAYWPKVGNFTKIGIGSKDRIEANQLDSSVMSFAKAYVTYQQTMKPTANTLQLYALRAIESACIAKRGNLDIVTLKAGDFDRAAQSARDNMGSGAAYQAGAQLKNLLDFLIDKKIIKPFLWKNPIKKAKDMGSTGEEAEKRRQDKMPDDNALMALAEISSMKTELLSPRDVFTSSTMALMFCAPSRGSEPMYLKIDGLHEETMTVKRALECGYTLDELNEIVKIRELVSIKDEKVVNPSSVIVTSVDTEKSNADKAGLSVDDEIKLYGLKWFSGKGFGHANKWLPTVIMDTAARVFKRLLAQSTQAREFSKMLEDSPDFPRHHLCPDVEEHQLLTKEQVSAALGLDLSSLEGTKKNNACNQFIKRKGVERKDYVVSLHDLNKIIRRDLPEDFPYIPFKTGEGKVKVKWSESLYTGFSNALNIKKSIIYTELTIPTINTLNEDLAPTKKVSKTTGAALNNTLSIFQRWEYGDLSMTSHQLRHMLDTMASVNGMEGEVRAKWAQRSDPKQNRAYNHTTPEEYGADFIEDSEKSIATQNKTENTQIQVQIATPRTIQELNTKASLSAHITEYGMCTTSYLSEPCEKYRDCINCNEHVCEKGDDVKCERIRKKLKREEQLLRKDKKALDHGVQGAEQWYTRRNATVERCRQLIGMLTDPNIEDGALIKLANIEDVTLLDRAMDANGKKRLPKIENFQRVNNVKVDELLGLELVEADDEEQILMDEMDDMDYLEDF
ncbi:integrase [Moritella marina ATCC 15381]|uniref:Integrase n=1 Tax=Moritella marina ATCC 15381 TaxID=1202962 RepID=A0A5J6WR64_MORMI|nr:hypothetical protein [Moritella marina]QFI39718.1 integrase [Moritella marina ATCC 15381]